LKVGVYADKGSHQVGGDQETGKDEKKAQQDPGNDPFEIAEQKFESLGHSKADNGATCQWQGEKEGEKRYDNRPCHLGILGVLFFSGNSGSDGSIFHPYHSLPLL
jgi:hypothetical protein